MDKSYVRNDEAKQGHHKAVIPKSMCRQNKPFFGPPCDKLVDTCKAFPGFKGGHSDNPERGFGEAAVLPSSSHICGSHLEYQWINMFINAMIR